MNWLDYVIIAIVCYNSILGLTSGLIRSLFSILALVGAFVLAPAVQPILTPFVQSFLQNNDPTMASPIAMTVAWIAIYMLVSIIGVVIGKLIQKTPLQIVDRLGGLAFGLIVSAFIIFLPLAFMESNPIISETIPIEETIKNSVTLPIFKPVKIIIQDKIGTLVVKYWEKYMPEPRIPEIDPEQEKKPKTKPTPLSPEDKSWQKPPQN